MPEHAYIVVSRTPIIVSGSPVEPGAALKDFDVKANARHLESGAVVRVEVDEPDDVGDETVVVEPQGDEPGEVETATPTTTRRRRRPINEETPDA